MEPKKVGRTLGIGVRVASKMLRERVEKAAASPAAPSAGENRRPAAASTPPAPPITARVETAKRGARAFGKAVWDPFSRAGSVLWLEITGLFFALFAVFFVQSVYRVRSDWRQGPEHSHLLLYAVLAAGFAWFSFSSFARAYRKSKRGSRTSVRPPAART
jgi:hypothetical protein